MKHTIIAKDKLHLKKLIEEEIKLKGYQCDLNHIDISQVTDLSCLFYNSQFNGNISNWNTSNVTTMRELFQKSQFNGDISKWDTSKVIDMAYMFAQAKFNKDIGDWDVSNVINMYFMFPCSDFNKDISKWDVRKVQSIVNIFNGSKFNRDISDWRPYSLSFGNYFEEEEMPIPYWGQFEVGDWKKRNIAIDHYHLNKELNKEISQSDSSPKKLKI